MWEWLKQTHNQLAVTVWGFGLYCMYTLATLPFGIAERIRNPFVLIVLVSAVLAVPVGWGIAKRQRWAKWVVVCMFVAMVAFMMRRAFAQRDAFEIVGLLVVGWSAVCLIRWDITGEVEGKCRMDQILESLQQNTRLPLPPSVARASVTLGVISMPPVTLESLAVAVESGFGRNCEICLSEDTIDLGVEAASTTDDTAVVGGVARDRYGLVIVGANPIAMEVAWIVTGGEGGPPISFLTIETPRQTRPTESKIDGYDWTIPLAAALWTSNTRFVTVDDEDLLFTSAEELLAWKTARRVSD